MPFKGISLKIDPSVDLVALCALVLSIVGVGWQLSQALIGAELEQLDYTGRVVELRCNSLNGEQCWDGDGHLAVILPVFFSNTGASGYNDALMGADLDLRVDRSTTPISMFATDIWYGTQNSSQPSSPFRPIVIGGRSANGHQLRFVGTDARTRLDWSDFAEHVINGDISTLILDTSSVFSIESGPIHKSCMVSFTPQLRSTLMQRRDHFSQQSSKKKRTRAAKHLTTFCR